MFYQLSGTDREGLRRSALQSHQVSGPKRLQKQKDPRFWRWCPLRGNPEIIFRRILTFTWSVGSLKLAGRFRKNASPYRLRLERISGTSLALEISSDCCTLPCRGACFVANCVLAASIAQDCTGKMG